VWCSILVSLALPACGNASFGPVEVLKPNHLLDRYYVHRRGGADAEGKELPAGSESIMLMDRSNHRD
jgi:hypothetical protein